MKRSRRDSATRHSRLVIARRLAAAIAFLVIPVTVASPQHEDERYVAETDPLVLKNLAHWQDIKFGLLMHWGPYSQWGVVESWSICAEDEGWCRRSLTDYKITSPASPFHVNPKANVATGGVRRVPPGGAARRRLLLEA
jgi:hypothetical protein